MSTSTGLLAIVALLAANAFFVAAEFSLVAVDRARMEAAADEGWDGPALERAVCHYRPSVVTALWHELEVTDSGISLCPMGDATLKAFAADQTAASALQEQH